MAKIGALSVDLSLETQNFLQSIKDSQEAVKQFDKDVRPLTKTLDDMGESMKSMGQTLSIGLTLPIIAFGATAVKQFSDSAESVALLENVIKSTGGAAGKSAEQMEKMATSLQNSSLFEDDEIIRKVLNQMLTFTNVAGDAFDRGSQAALNLSTALGQDLQSSAIQVGKALNDPIAGVTALRRVGVQLSDDQKDLIKSFVDVGDVASAQNVILQELEKEFGGAAEAASKAGTGPFKQLQIQMGNLTEDFGKLIVNAILPLAGYLSDAVRWVSSLSDEWKTAILVIGGVLAALGPVLLVLGSMATGLASLIGLWGTVSVAISAAGGIFAALGAALGPVIAVLTGPVGIIALIGAAAVAVAYFAAQTEAGQEIISAAWNAIKAGAEIVWGGILSVVGTVTDALSAAWVEVGAELGDTWDSIAEAATAFWADFGEPIKAGLSIIALEFKVQFDVAKAVVSTVFGEIGVIVRTAFDVLKGLVGGALQEIRGVMEVVTGLLTGDWSKFAQGFSDIWGGLWRGIVSVISAPVNFVVDTVKNFAINIAGFLSNIVNDVARVADALGLTGLAASLRDAGKWIDAMAASANATSNALKGTETITKESTIAAINHASSLNSAASAMSGLGSAAPTTKTALGHVQVEIAGTEQTVQEWINTNDKYGRELPETWSKVGTKLEESDLDLALARQKNIVDTMALEVKAANDKVGVTVGANTQVAASHTALYEHSKSTSQLIAASWNQSIVSLGNSLSSQLASMVTNWDFSWGGMLDTLKNTGKHMLDSLVEGFIKPFTDSLSTIGTSLIGQLTGTGGSGGLGGILTGILGGGTPHLPGGALGPVLPGGGTGGSLGSIGSFLGSTAGIATMGIGAAAIGITSWIKSQAHWEASDLVNNIQAPFDQAVASIVDKVTIGKQNGTLQQIDVLEAQQGLHELWMQVQNTVETWRTAKGNSSDRDRVASQFHGTEDAFMANQLSGIDALAHFHYWDTSYRDGSVNDAAAATLPHYAMGTPWVPQDGPAYLHRGEAVIPAAQNGNKNAVTVTVSPVYNLSVGGGGSTRKSDIDELKWIFKNNTNGVAEAVARAMRDMVPGLVTA